MHLPTDVPALEYIARHLTPLLDAPPGPEHAVHLALVAGLLLGQGMAPPEVLSALRQLESQGAFPLAALAAHGVYWHIPGPVAGAPWYYHARGPAAVPRAEKEGALA